MSAEPLAARDVLDTSAMEPVSLAEVLAEAPRLTRVDRKYVVHVDAAAALLDAVAGRFRVLAVAGRRATTYRSTYVDTVDLATCRAHVQRRRRRWKARSRLYVEDSLCRFEVKTKDGRGATVKTVVDRDADRYGRYGDAERELLRAVLADRGIQVDAERLLPTMEVGYRRCTLADTDAGTRVTLDWDVECALGRGRVRLDRSAVLVETKGDACPSPADRALLAMGARPVPFSKYASAAALLRPDIPDNDVRRYAGSVLHVTPATHLSLASTGAGTGQTSRPLEASR